MEEPPTRVAILVLGAAVRPDGTASPTLARRTRHAAALWRAGAGTIVIPCGGTGRHPPSEAEVMAAILSDCGVPADAIHREDRSTSTAQNIRNAKAILDRLAVARVVIVSDRYHLPRARLLARRAGLTVTTSAAPLAGARAGPQMRGALREIPAYLAALLGMSR